MIQCAAHLHTGPRDSGSTRKGAPPQPQAFTSMDLPKRTREPDSLHELRSLMQISICLPPCAIVNFRRSEADRPDGRTKFTDAR